MDKRNISPTLLRIFPSKRKRTLSAKINIPLTSSNAVLQPDFWPRFVNLCQTYIDDLEDIINRIHGNGTIIILGDFNGHVGTHLGVRNFNTTNQRGLQLARLMVETNFVSINSQTFCRGPTETFYLCNGSQISSIDHIMIRKDDVHLVKECRVSNDNCDNLSYHLPIFCTICIPIELNKVTKKCKCRLAWKTIQNEKILKSYQEKSKEFKSPETLPPFFSTGNQINQFDLQDTIHVKD